MFYWNERVLGIISGHKREVLPNRKFAVWDK